MIDQIRALWSEQVCHLPRALDCSSSNHTYRLCVKPFSTCVTLCLLCNFSCFYWRLLAFFSKFTFICRSWSGSKLIAYAINSRLSYHTPKKYVEEGSGQTLRASSWEFCIIAYASSECPDEPTQTHSIITVFTAGIEKRSDADEGSGPTKSLLRQWFCCCWFVL